MSRCAAISHFVSKFVIAPAVVIVFSMQAHAQGGNACALLSRTQITKATGLHVTKGKQGPPMAGAIGNCWWETSDGTKIVVTLADTSHMQVTMQSQTQSGAAAIDGLGTSAVGTAGNSETDGGYNLSVLDKQGGVAVSITGKAGTGERTVALAKVIETHRATP
jgi:hypothetical protein